MTWSCFVQTSMALFAGSLRESYLPIVKDQNDWASAFRKQVRRLGEGWTARKSSRTNKVTLELRANNQKRQEVTLPFKWDEDSAGDAYTRIRNIFSLVAKNGYSLKQASLIASGRAPKLINQLDWAGAINDFKIFKTTTGRSIAETTWNKEYFLSEEETEKRAANIKGNMRTRTVFPVLNNALQLLEKGSITTPEDLIDESVRGWTAGSRSRQQAVRNLASFLSYCDKIKKFPVQWDTTFLTLKDHIGVIPKNQKKKSQKADAVEDHILLDLIDHVESLDKRWAFALKLMSELGLRPVELLHLEIRKHEGEKEWFCTYEKKAGNGSTRAGELFPIKLKNKKGISQEWNLMETFEKGEILPDLSTYKYGVADGLKNFLERRSATRKDGTKGALSKQAEKWFELKEQVFKEEKKNLTLYSFRHSYSLRAHQRGIDPASVALAMRHDLKTHCSFYPWAEKKAVKDIFKEKAA
jgi:integrase